MEAYTLLELTLIAASMFFHPVQPQQVGYKPGAGGIHPIPTQDSLSIQQSTSPALSFDLPPTLPTTIFNDKIDTKKLDEDEDGCILQNIAVKVNKAGCTQRGRVNMRTCLGMTASAMIVEIGSSTINHTRHMTKCKAVINRDVTRTVKLYCNDGHKEKHEVYFREPIKCRTVSGDTKTKQVFPRVTPPPPLPTPTTDC